MALLPGWIDGRSCRGPRWITAQRGAWPRGPSPYGPSMAMHILTLACPDRPGIVASIAQGLLELGANILENAQFGDTATHTFCMRTRFESPVEDADEIRRALTPRAEELAATLDVHAAER